MWKEVWAKLLIWREVSFNQGHSKLTFVKGTLWLFQRHLMSVRLLGLQNSPVCWEDHPALLPHRLILLLIYLTYLYCNMVILPFCAFRPSWNYHVLFRTLKIVICIELNSVYQLQNPWRICGKKVNDMRPMIRVFFFFLRTLFLTEM